MRRILVPARPDGDEHCLGDREDDDQEDHEAEDSIRGMDSLMELRP